MPPGPDVAMQTQAPEHLSRIRARRVRQKHLAPPQAGQHARQAPFDPHQFFDGEVVRFTQETVRIDAMMAHQSEHRGAIAPPIVESELIGLCFGEVQMAPDEIDHPGVDRGEDRVRRLVQRVVQVEEPDPTRGLPKLVQWPRR